jgi:ankyrin repeat protein
LFALFFFHFFFFIFQLPPLSVDTERLDEEGWTALHRAATEGNVDDMKQLLDFGAFVDEKSKVCVVRRDSLLY